MGRGTGVEDLVHAHLYVLDHRELLLSALAQQVVLWPVNHQRTKLRLAGGELPAQRWNLCLQCDELGAEFVELCARARLRRVHRGAVRLKLLRRAAASRTELPLEGLVVCTQLLDRVCVPPALAAMLPLELFNLRAALRQRALQLSAQPPLCQRRLVVALRSRRELPPSAAAADRAVEARFHGRRGGLALAVVLGREQGRDIDGRRQLRRRENRLHLGAQHLLGGREKPQSLLSRTQRLPGYRYMYYEDSTNSGSRSMAAWR